jgi:hypothetical protein
VIAQWYVEHLDAASTGTWLESIIIMTRIIERSPLPPCQSDMSHKGQHNPWKSPAKQWPQEVGYSILESIEFEFALQSNPKSM